MDPSLQQQGDSINFNGGLRTHSISMKVSDFIAIEKPTIAAFTS
jgi:prolyl-tRNA editing enzyme YbaK/EbsC (Cys-tRNA(Pro) deacylase)